MINPALRFDGYVLSLGRYQTPHNNTGKQSVNEDFGLYAPGAGLIVADGVGGAKAPEHSAAISRLAVETILREASDCRIRNAPTDEALDIVREQILPYVDSEIGEYKSQLNAESPEDIRQISTVIGGLLFGRDDTLIALGVGDIRVLHYNTRGIIPKDLVNEQIVDESPNFVTNYLAGEGRQQPNQDQVVAVTVAPDDRLIVTSDGFHGDYSWQRVPEWVVGEKILNHATAKDLVYGLSRLPLELALSHPDAFLPKSDDMTIGALYVNAQTG